MLMMAVLAVMMAEGCVVGLEEGPQMEFQGCLRVVLGERGHDSGLGCIV